MKIRNAKLKDIPKIMEIYDIARKYMRANNNKNQWINGYPQKEIIEKDIEKASCYICYENNGKENEEEILAVFYFAIEEEPTYNKIYEGKWLNDEEYGVIHRLGVAKQKQGIAGFCMNWCAEKVKNIRVDTHRDNIPMQRLLKKLGYQYCGIIYINDGSERLGFQKVIVGKGSTYRETYAS